jgi:hypothetical protein
MTRDGIRSWIAALIPPRPPSNEFLDGFMVGIVVVVMAVAAVLLLNHCSHGPTA